MATMNEQECGRCHYFDHYEGRMGYCEIPLPECLVDKIARVDLEVNVDDGSDCSCFELPESEY